MVTRKPIGKPMDSGGRVWDVALGQAGDGPVVASVGDDGRLRMWDPTTRRLIGAPVPTGHADGTRTVTIGEINGRPVVLTGGDEDSDGGGSVRVWDLDTLDPLGEELEYGDWVGSVAIAQVDGKAVAVTGEDDGEVRMRELSAYAR
ncbi:hypothetical protein OIE66_37230 [Nonomuraea sp. NBC_01738]|uniref:WD40 repeat domain-containing protein n=1 Tax=Nonomuraea sp. NBC_01738 TaxID=2976003 RepID=UPI002E0F2FAB|nr:hypothetical protein OIE66_37230 [Nonomuraea sp. NBC_01738]